MGVSFLSSERASSLWHLSPLLPLAAQGLLPGTWSNEMFPVLISLSWEEPFYLCCFLAIKAYSTPSTARPLAMLSSPASCLEVLIHSLWRQARGGCLWLISQTQSLRNCLWRLRLSKHERWKQEMAAWSEMEGCTGSFCSSFNSEKYKGKRRLSSSAQSVHCLPVKPPCSFSLMSCHFSRRNQHHQIFEIFAEVSLMILCPF